MGFFFESNDEILKAIVGKIQMPVRLRKNIAKAVGQTRPHALIEKKNAFGAGLERVQVILCLCKRQKLSRLFIGCVNRLPADFSCENGFRAFRALLASLRLNLIETNELVPIQRDAFVSCFHISLV